jgi:dolichol-phosphate mannosyltransferase
MPKHAISIENRNEPRTILPRSAVTLGIVCPMANEGDEAVPFCRAVLEQCSGFQKVTFFAVFDGVTKDSSLDQMRALGQSEPRLHVVWAPENRCVVDAYLRGYKEALDGGCDWILEIDAGFSHQPEDIPQFFDAMEEGMDCVFGSRFIGRFEKVSFKRRVISWGGTKLANLLLGTRQTDMTSGFELFSRETLTMVMERNIQSRAHFFQTEIKAYCKKLKFAEVPITYRSASARLGLPSLMDAFRQLWRLLGLRLREQL